MTVRTRQQPVTGDASILDGIRLDRRRFLQGLAAVGAVIALPVSLVDATATQVEEAWQALVEDPWYFEVNDYRTLVESGVCEPERREDVYEFVDSRPLTPDDLIREVESCPPLLSEFQTQAADAGEAYADDLDLQVLLRHGRRSPRRTRRRHRRG
jgi:hypothetical protein